MLKNQLLQQALAKTEQGVQDKASYDKIYKSGLKVIYNKDTFQQLAQSVAQSKNPAQDIAKGIVAVLSVMAEKAKGTIPHAPLLQAGMALVLDALDFMEQAGLGKIDKSVLDEATSAYVDAILPLVGLTTGKLNAALGQIRDVSADPQRMAQYKGSLK